jgi:hypothetical protein
MNGGRSTGKTWLIRVAPQAAQIRCSFHRIKNRVVRFVVQLEIFHQGSWVPVVRYDNAHGYCHRDTLHPDGSKDKTSVAVGDLNQTFTWAIEDLRENWEAQRTRYLTEVTT